MSPATVVIMLIVLLVNIDTALSQPAPGSPANLSRSNFPAGFVFGTASSAYQYEGAANEGGRGPSVWDTVAHTPGAIVDNSTGDVAVDQYHRYQEDIGLMTNVGFDAYRFSISWSRIFPDGRAPAPNAEGVAHYNRLINGLLAKGIQPYVTLYHWDLPQALEDDFGGWLSPQIVPLFAAYAEACFAAFGDRVKFWITFNEPHGFATGQTNEGCRNASGSCGPGYYYSQVYQVGHHVILSHAAAVTTYRTKYQTQKGRIGISLDITWFEPLSSRSFADMVASERMQAFQVGWFLDPMFSGDYPLIMRKYIGNRLPYFSKEESQAVKGTVDFVGVNHYTTYYVTNRPSNSTLKYGIMFDDPRVEVSAVKKGVLIGPMAASYWLRIVPWGMQKALNHVRVAYNNPPIYITENGMDESSDPSVPPDQSLQDAMRIRFYHDYLTYVLAAIRDGTDVRGHFAWSLLDNFEWNDGFSKRFGLYFVDYTHNLTRIPKASVSWYTELLRRV